MAKTKTTLDSLANNLGDLTNKMDGLANNLGGLTENVSGLTGKVSGLTKKVNNLTIGFKKMTKRLDSHDVRFNKTDVAIENLALITKQGFDNVDFKFAVVDDRLKELQANDQRLESKIDRVHDEVVKNGDAFARLKNYIDAETAAVRSHLLRVNEKVGLA
ncbi:MAG: hypothetical protein V1664_04950 [Candidatus Uhrbacteria bacterium]